jgi:hypothetical protein
MGDNFFRLPGNVYQRHLQRADTKENAMKKILLSTTALLGLAVAPALAADLPARVYSKAPYTAPAMIYN